MARGTVSIVTVEAVPTAVIRERTDWQAYPRLWPRLLEEVWRVVRADPDAQPDRNVMLYLDFAPNVEVGVEIGGTFAGNGRVAPSQLPAGEAATAVAIGAPSAERIAAAHAAVVRWCDANRRKRSGVRWEVYAHWLDDQDPKRYETRVFWLLEPER